ncbi:hypothetical protein B0H10DRAFT_2224967 [Mycena sp. CBHHK59/15]|nr:hypothetical protein B0H10DRAFT_2224967 [Mycena sp. CBHHK59/15]
MIKDHRDNTKLRIEWIRPRSSPFFTVAHLDPASIDQLLPPHLLDTTLPSALASLIDEIITQGVTPPLMWGGDPSVSRNGYVNCIVHATMIGRAFSFLMENRDGEEAAAAGACINNNGEDFGNADVPVFIKALMSGSDPAPASRFAAAILFLTCSASMQAARPPLRGRGIEYDWMSGNFKDETWSMWDLKAALDNTAALPRENWNLRIEGSRRYSEYVPLECIKMLDAARKHVESGERDMTSAEVVKLALQVLWDVEESTETHNGDRSDYLGDALIEWKQEWEGEWTGQT